MALEALDIANGIILLIFCSMSIYIGLRITSKYFKLKKREYLLVGFTWIFLTNPWYSATISFVMFLVAGTVLSPEAYFIIGTNLMPIALVLWMTAFTDLVYPKLQKIIIIIFTAYGVLFYGIFYSLLLADPSLIGELKGYTDVQYNTFIVVYALSILVIMLITGYLFCRESLKSEKPEIRLKGKLLLTAFILFVIGSSLDTSIPLTFLTLPIVRGFEIASAIAFYGGYVLPNWMKKLFLKEN